MPLVQDGSKAWIPVQFLFVDGPQPFAHYGHLTNFIREKIRTSVNLHSSIIERLYRKNVSQYKYKFDEDSPAFFAKSATVAKDSSLVREPGARKCRITAEKQNMKIDTIYISSQASMSGKGDIRGKVLGGLASLGYEVTGFTSYSPEDVLTSDFDMLSSSDAKFIFAIIDNDSMSDKDPQKVVRKLHRWADCTRGVLLVCATKSHLIERYGSKNGPYLPSSLRHKINHMLGRPNFDLSKLKEASQLRKGSLMIAGGHVAHHIDDRTYLPSITAIVANTSKSVSKFLGSSRYHITTEIKFRTDKADQDLNPIRRLIQPARREITSMMEDRFRAYGATPSRLLFYFDGATFEDQTHGDYCESIKEAYKTVFPTAGQLQLTYIVVKRNTHLKYDEQIATVGSGISPLFAFVTEASSAAKYRYYVVKNDEQWTVDDLVDIVSTF